ncbi:MAG: alpha-1,2-fucosyltransferase [Candidatus Paceibacterota bacterium]|jgi:hypothetical protein
MIITRLKGGMGNQMFQYALGRALSIKYNVPLGLDLAFLLDRTPRPKFHQFSFRNYDLDVFNVNVKIISQSKIPFFHRQYFKGKIMVYINGLISIFDKIFRKEKYFVFKESVLNKGPNAYLDGYWQNPKYFDGIKDILRKDFTIKDLTDQNIQNLSKDILSQNSLCIHVRRGDFVSNKNHDIVAKNYYNERLEYLKKIVSVDKIYVFSDDISWCKENLIFDIPTIFVENSLSGKKGEGHLYLMSCCKYFIIPNSTFSWWGAWLSIREEKIVICPKKWLNSEVINTDDLIPKEWIRI